MIEKTIDFDAKQVKTIQVENKINKFYYSQACLCCDNTRRLPEGMHFSSTPWICGECREAIAFLKDLKKSVDAIEEFSKQETSIDVKPL